ADGAPRHARADPRSRLGLASSRRAANHRRHDRRRDRACQRLRQHSGQVRTKGASGMNTNGFRIAVFAGDGIGNEVTEPCLSIVDRAIERVGGVTIEPVRLAAGAGAYRETGEALPRASLAEARKADAILLAAMGDPAVRYPD